MPQKKRVVEPKRPWFFMKKGFLGYKKSSATRSVSSPRAFRKRPRSSKCQQDTGNSTLIEKPKSLLGDTLPLRVVLPPLECTKDSGTATIFTIDKEKKMSPDIDTTDNNVTDNSLNVEEYECGVSVAGSDKQEWAFTLYDFDGRGKITKEDLGQLLKSLYDAVGSSISLPKAGAKSLKLKLTVSPDHTKASEGSNKPTSTTMALVSSPIKTSHHRHSKSRQHRSSKHSKDKENRRQDNNISHKLNNLGASGEKNGESSGKNKLSGEGRVPQNGVVVGGGASEMNSSEQKQLVQLVQKNMDRHHRQLRKVRRHNSDQVSSSRRRTSGTPATSPREQENPDRRNYYMDLAGIDHDPNTEKVLNTSAPAAIVEPSVDNALHANGKSGKHSSQEKGKHRSSKHHHHKRDRDTGERKSGGREGKRSHKQSLSPHSEEPDSANSPSAAVLMFDPVVNCEIERTAEHLVEHNSPPPPPPPAPVLQEITPQSTSSPRVSPRTAPKLSSTPKSSHKVRPVSSPILVKDMALSPHHQRRHKHRDKQHQRAMQQVAAWIEREHSLSPGSQLMLERPGLDCVGLGGEHMLIQRHEHHHIHEHHHHHHYHHYHEA